MTTIVTLDGALAETGVALWRNEAISVRTIHTRHHDGPVEARWAAIGEQIWPVLGPETLVVLEGVFVSAKLAGASMDLAMLHGTLRLGLWYRKIPFAIVDPMAVKMYATGYGRATKREMIAATSRMRLGFALGDEHQADALWLLAMTLDHYGAPMCDTFEAGRKALARIAWPDFSLGKAEWR